MEHHFNCEIAGKYGIAEAIILNHFEYWIEKNKANEKNFFEGTYWTYNSVKAFKKIFPYLTEKKIASALANLKREELIKTGNFNENKYDRTLWYAITEKGISILQNGRMENPEKENRKPENGEPIPNNNTNINTNNNTNNINNEFEILWQMYPRKVGKQKALRAYQKARKSGTSFEAVKDGLEAYTKHIRDKRVASEYIKHGATWFNGECWNDEYSVAVPPEEDDLAGIL